MTWRDASDFAKETSPDDRANRSIVRKWIVQYTEGARWQMKGAETDAGTEIHEHDVYQGIGFFARPHGKSLVESIVLQIGGSKTTAAVAMRELGGRIKKLGDIARDTTLLFNTLARLVLLPDGSIEARTHGGTAVQLATKQDVENLAVFVNGLFVGGTGSVVIPPNTVPRPIGTTKFKAE